MLTASDASVSLDASGSLRSITLQSERERLRDFAFETYLDVTGHGAARRRRDQELVERLTEWIVAICSGTPADDPKALRRRFPRLPLAQLFKALELFSERLPALLADPPAEPGPTSEHAAESQPARPSKAAQQAALSGALCREGVLLCHYATTLRPKPSVGMDHGGAGMQQLLHEIRGTLHRSKLHLAFLEQLLEDAANTEAQQVLQNANGQLDQIAGLLNNHSTGQVTPLRSTCVRALRVLHQGSKPLVVEVDREALANGDTSGWAAPQEINQAVLQLLEGLVTHILHACARVQLICRWEDDGAIFEIAATEPPTSANEEPALKGSLFSEIEDALESGPAGPALRFVEVRGGYVEPDPFDGQSTLRLYVPAPAVEQEAVGEPSTPAVGQPRDPAPAAAQSSKLHGDY